MRPVRAIVVGTAALSLIATSQAAAASNVPKFKNNSIVPGVSIGGVKVGMTKKQAVAVWGKPTQCFDNGCHYQVTEGGFFVEEIASFHMRKGKITVVLVEAQDRDPKIAAKVNKLKTSKKIKLGSTMDAARKAYKIKDPGNTGEAGRSRALYRKGKLCTMFYAPQSPYVRIDAIATGLCNANAGLLTGIR